MLLFHNKGEKQREPDPAADRKALVIANAIYKAQEKAAGWLGRRYGALPFRAKTLCLVLFCLLLGGTSGWILAQAVLPGPKPAALPGLQTTTNAPPALPQEHHRQQLKGLHDSLGHPDKILSVPPLK